MWERLLVIARLSAAFSADRKLGCQRSPDSLGSSSACSPSLQRHTIDRTSMRTIRMRSVSSRSTPSSSSAAIFLSGSAGLVEAWAEIHQAELLAAWDRLQAGRPPGKIEPLR